MDLFADVSFTTEGIVVVGGLLGILAGAVGYIFRLLIASKDAQIEMRQAEAKFKDEESAKKSYREIAEEAVAMAEARVNHERAKVGKPAAKVVAPIVPEHSSPVTKEQQATADLQTLRARVTAATLALDMPAREPGIPEGVAGELVAPGTVEKLKADVAELKQEQLRTDIAEVKSDVAEVPEKTVEKLNEDK